MYKLRGHHIFCLLGYRGMGYSKEYVDNMTRLHQTLRDHPKTWVELVKGPDQLCEKYPNSGEYHCQKEHIYHRDSIILEKLGLEIGQILNWEDIEASIRKSMSYPLISKPYAKPVPGVHMAFVKKGFKTFTKAKGLREVH